MSERNKVTVIKFGDRPHYQMQWIDPRTGRKKTKSTRIPVAGGKRSRQDAERVAAKQEDELNDNDFLTPGKFRWADFRERYEAEILNGLAIRTQQKCVYILNKLEELIRPERLTDVTAEKISYLAGKLRELKLAEATIKGYLAHIKAMLRWGHDCDLLRVVPKIKMPHSAKTAKVAKGRPITAEEFERMLDKVSFVLADKDKEALKKVKDKLKKDKDKEPGQAKVGKGPKTKPPKQERIVPAAVIESWCYCLRGLWLSGLRLDESLRLYWDGSSSNDRLVVSLSGKRPMLLIPADGQKSRQDQILPITPDFAEFLLKTPPSERHGRVFRPLGLQQGVVGRFRVSSIICRIGKAAGVKVHTYRDGRIKFASAHDLRRSFAERWAPRVMPTVLKLLMRHESIETTMKYYVGRNAEATAEIVWDAHEKATGQSTRNDSAQGSTGTTSRAAEGHHVGTGDGTP